VQLVGGGVGCNCLGEGCGGCGRTARNPSPPQSAHSPYPAAGTLRVFRVGDNITPFLLAQQKSLIFYMVAEISRDYVSPEFPQNCCKAAVKSASNFCRREHPLTLIAFGSDGQSRSSSRYMGLPNRVGHVLYQPNRQGAVV
jgi:hypothetical protein